MDTVISFTPAQIWTATITVCAGLCTIAGAIALIVRVVNRAKTPNAEQNKRITALETRVAKHDEMLDNDNQRLKSIETANRVVLKGMQALLRHGINGNDIEALKGAEKDVNKYLIDR